MSNEIKLPIWVCENCGSSNVQQKAWVDLNSTNPSIDFYENIEKEDCWCKNCLEHTNLIMKENE